MTLDPSDLRVESFSTAEFTVAAPAPTGPEGPYSLCWICRPTDPFVPTCGPTTCVVDSYCQCYA